jgi:hypothetical protein
MNGSNKDGTVGITLNLLSQLGDAVVYRSITGPLALWPRGTHQPLAGNYNLGPGDQKFKHFELSQSDLNRLTAATEFHGSEIQGNISKLRHLIDASDVKI